MSGLGEPVLAPAMRKLEKRIAFSAEDRAAFLALPVTVKTLDARRYIVREEDRAASCCVLVSGFAYRHKVVAGGARQILSIQIPGDIVDLQNSFLGIADHSVQMLTSGNVALLPVKAVEVIAFQRPTIGRAMLLDTLVDGSIYREWMANVGRRDARTRLAHLLCEIAVRLEGAGLGAAESYRLPMSQEDLGDATGLTQVHVNRTLQGLRHDGLISTDKRSITIDDWAALAETGDFRVAYLHPLHSSEPN